MRLRTFLSAATLFITSTSLLGCLTFGSTSNANTLSLNGNWQISSGYAAAARLPVISGSLTGSGSRVTGIFHSASAQSCLPPDQPIEISGTLDSLNKLTLAADVAGGTLALSGTLASDGKSLTNASYSVSGGTCAFSAMAQANAQVYSSINGTFSGTFSDPSGQVVALTAQLTQTPASDPNGNFALSGSANFNNPCFTNPVQVSNSQVSGGSFSLTYADAVTQNSVDASGTFSTDGKTLTVTAWTLSGPCGPDGGTGTLSR